MIEFAKRYGGNVHSQNGEDGIILECLRRMNIIKGHAVEIGANDGLWMSNIRLLLERGFSGKYVETEYGLYLQCYANWAHRKDVTCICSRVDGHNVNAFVKDDCDVLSMDTDGGDYNIFAGLKARPKIIIIEVDSTIPPDREGFNSDGGAGYRTMLELAYIKDYFLLAHTGNLVLIDEQYRDLFPELKGNPLTDSELYFNRGWLHASVGAN